MVGSKSERCEQIRDGVIKKFDGVTKIFDGVNKIFDGVNQTYTV